MKKVEASAAWDVLYAVDGGWDEHHQGWWHIRKHPTLSGSARRLEFEPDVHSKYKAAQFLVVVA